MARSFYHQHPDTLTLEAEVVDSRPGRVLLLQSPSRAIRVLKIDNKGRHNRRIRIGLADAVPGTTP